MKILIDTNIIDTGIIETLINQGYEVCVAKATKDRELKVGSEYLNRVQYLPVANEAFLFGESTFPISFGSNKNLEQIIGIVSSGSFPKQRGALTDKQRNQLRDAMILESAIRGNCDVLCSNDKKAFVNAGKREILESMFKIEILTKQEIEEKYV